MRQLPTLVLRTVRAFMADDCMQLAGAVAYFALFAVFPLVIFLVAVLGLVLNDPRMQSQFIDQVLDYLPLTDKVGQGTVADTIRSVAKASGTLGVLSLAGMAWSGSNLFSVLRKAINTAFGLKPKASFIKDKATDLLMVATLPILFLLSIALTTVIASARALGGQVLLVGPDAQSLGWLGGGIAVVASLAVSCAAFLALYWTAPNPRIRLRDLWPGALVAALLFEVAKAGFALYVANFGKYDAVYGSLGAAVALLFWIYVSAAILLFGAEVASEYPGVYRGERPRLAETGTQISPAA